jgi:hypothetical protein
VGEQSRGFALTHADGAGEPHDKWLAPDRFRHGTALSQERPATLA